MRAVKRVDRQTVPLKPTQKNISEILFFLRFETRLPADFDLPAWLPAANPAENEGLPPTTDLLVLPNALVDVRTSLTYPINPRLVSLEGTDIPWSNDAECPQWLAVLDQGFAGDEEQIDILQRWFGYVLMSATALQSVLLLIGKPRSGKGTIARVLRMLVGAQNYVEPSLTSLGERFGLEPLIGRRLAVVDEPALGSRADRSEIASVIRKLSGEDDFTVDRKHAPAWTGRLRLKLMLISNDIPALSDFSGALLARFVVLTTMDSFVGREDRTIETRLFEERSGILRWALEGARLLSLEGKFTQPTAAKGLLKQIRAQLNDVGDFVAEMCSALPGEHSPKAEPTAYKNELFAAYNGWRNSSGLRDEKVPEQFFKKLRQVVSSLEDCKLRDMASTRRPAFKGIRLKTSAELARESDDDNS